MISEPEKKVSDIVSKILKINESKLVFTDDLVEKFGMDSMQRVEIVIELEKVFDISIPDEDAVSLRSIRKILDYIKIKI